MNVSFRAWRDRLVAALPSPVLDRLRKAVYTTTATADRGVVVAARALRAGTRGRLGPADDRLRPPVHEVSDTRTWFADHGRPGDYLEVDAAIDVETPLPATVEPHVHRVFRDGTRDHHPPTWVAVLEGARVYGETGSVITGSNELLSEPSVAWHRDWRSRGRHPTIANWRLEPVTDLAGTTAVLTTHGADGLYYHWMFQLLPRIELIRRAGFEVDQIDHFVVSSTARAYERSSLELFGVPEGKIVSSREHPHVRTQRLLVPSVPLIGGRFRPWMVESVRRAVLPHDSPERPVAGSRFYIARGDAAYRRVTNEAEVIRILRGYGFEPLEMSGLPLPEQASLMAQVEALVAPHGGGLTNLAFCSRGARVLEIFSPELVALYYWRLASQVGVDYSYMLGAGARPDDAQSHDARADITVDLDKLRQAVDAMLA